MKGIGKMMKHMMKAHSYHLMDTIAVEVGKMGKCMIPLPMSLMIKNRMRSGRTEF